MGSKDQHANAKIVRDGYLAFAQADLGWMDENLSDDVVWHVPGSHDFAGDFQGKEEVLGLFARLAQAVDVDTDVHDVVANDEHAAAILTTKLTRRNDGESYEDRAVQVFHLDEEGRATEVWSLNQDQGAVDRFLAEAQ